MPGSPPTSPRFGVARYADTDTASFSAQVNAITDGFDARAAKTWNYLAKSSAYTALEGDYVFAATSVTVTLPTPTAGVAVAVQGDSSVTGAAPATVSTGSSGQDLRQGPRDELDQLPLGDAGGHYYAGRRRDELAHRVGRTGLGLGRARAQHEHQHPRRQRVHRRGAANRATPCVCAARSPTVRAPPTRARWRRCQRDCGRPPGRLRAAGPTTPRCRAPACTSRRVEPFRLRTGLPNGVTLGLDNVIYRLI